MFDIIKLDNIESDSTSDTTDLIHRMFHALFLNIFQGEKRKGIF